MVIDHTLSLVVSWLESDDCPVRHRLSFGTVDQLINLLTSYLTPKLSTLSMCSLRHLCTLLLKVGAFVRES